MKKVDDCDKSGQRRKGGVLKKRVGKSVLPLDNGGGSDVMAVSLEKCFGAENNTFYGQHSEESDICRSNKRQWEVLNRDYEEKLLSAIVALGVVDKEGRSNLENRILCLENGEKVSRRAKS